MTYPQSIQVFERLKSGDRIRVVHEVKVGFRKWPSTTTGTVVRTDRRRHSLHYQRNNDDKVFSDIIILKRDDGELTTVTLDEFTDLSIIQQAEA
jgi:hypothetical protein